jgi:hypothetical protein
MITHRISPPPAAGGAALASRRASSCIIVVQKARVGLSGTALAASRAPQSRSLAAHACGPRGAPRGGRNVWRQRVTWRWLRAVQRIRRTNFARAAPGLAHARPPSPPAAAASAVRCPRAGSAPRPACAGECLRSVRRPRGVAAAARLAAACAPRGRCGPPLRARPGLWAARGAPARRIGPTARRSAPAPSRTAAHMRRAASCLSALPERAAASQPVHGRAVAAAPRARLGSRRRVRPPPRSRLGAASPCRPAFG